MSFKKKAEIIQEVKNIIKGDYNKDVYLVDLKDPEFFVLRVWKIKDLHQEEQIFSTKKYNINHFIIHNNLKCLLSDACIDYFSLNYDLMMWTHTWPNSESLEDISVLSLEEIIDHISINKLLKEII